MKRVSKAVFCFFALLFLTGCEDNSFIVSGVSEKEANVILVMLESKNIPATKMLQATSGAGGDSAPKFSISVPQSQAIDAISFLNQNGLPKQKGMTLLELFAKQGLMTTEREENIRYQAGLSQQISNTIMMIDGVIDATVQLSFPKESTIPGQEQTEQKITAAVYVKHQGVVDDPNSHLEDKIKRLVSGSVTGLAMEDVTIVSDRSRFTDITLDDMGSQVSDSGDYVSIWSITMSKNSAMTFRVIFFLLTSLLIVFALLAGWLIWKIYPIFTKGRGGIKTLFSPAPLDFPSKSDEQAPPPEG